MSEVTSNTSNGSSSNKHRNPRNKKTSNIPSIADTAKLFSLNSYQNNIENIVKNIIAQKQEVQLKNGPGLYDFLSDNFHTWLESLISENSNIVDTNIYKFVLELTPKLKKQPKDKVDMQLILLKVFSSIINIIQEEESDEVANNDKFLTEEIKSIALKLLLNENHETLIPNPRAAEFLINVYTIQLSVQQQLNIAHNLFTNEYLRECGDFLMRNHLVKQFQNNQSLLEKCLEAGSMDVVYNFLSSVTDDTIFHRKLLTDCINCCVQTKNNAIAVKLLNHFNIPLSEYPDVRYNKQKDLIWWLCCAGKVDEFVDLILNHNEDSWKTRLQLKICRELFKNRYKADRALLLNYIKKWNLQNEEEITSWKLDQSLSESSEIANTIAIEESKLPLYIVPKSSIIFVNTMELLRLAETELGNQSEDSAIIGLDLEHTPENFSGLNYTPKSVQILQISTLKSNFIFDLNSFNQNTPNYNEEFNQAFELLLMNLFDSEEQIKIGMSFGEDMKKLHNDYSYLAAFQVSVQNYVDLLQLCKIIPDPEGDQLKLQRKQIRRIGWRKKRNTNTTINNNNNNTNTPKIHHSDSEDDFEDNEDEKNIEDEKEGDIDNNNSNNNNNNLSPEPWADPSISSKEGGLARLTRLILQQKLDKTCQISDWSRRPLNENQLNYAACDARVQIDIYKKALQQGYKFDIVNIER